MRSVLSKRITLTPNNLNGNNFSNANKVSQFMEAVMWQSHFSRDVSLAHWPSACGDNIYSTENKVEGGGGGGREGREGRETSSEHVQSTHDDLPCLLIT